MNPTTALPSQAPDTERLTVGAVSKVMWRLIPLTMVLYLFNYLDRVNVAFAKLEMNKSLGFSDAIYGFGASVFFFGYFVFELPSNLIMQKVGARLWIARIMISWGVVSVAMAFVNSPATFYTARFFLGVAEAGFFPAIILYLTYWIPRKQRALAGALFLTSLALAGVVGGPIAGTLMKINAAGFVGWQWLFLLEGIPTVIIGFLVLVLLPDKPQDVSWLSEAEKNALSQAIKAEQETQQPEADRVRFALGSGKVWALCLLYSLILVGFYGLGYWIPSIIKQVSNAPVSIVGWLSAIPFIAAVVAMLPIAYATDRRRSPLRVVAMCLTAGAVGMLICAYSTSTITTIVALSVAASGIYSALAPFWAVPPAVLRGSAAAAGIAIINSCGNLGGGLVGPNVFGQLRSLDSSYSMGLYFCAGVLLLSAMIAFAMDSAFKPSEKLPVN